MSRKGLRFRVSWGGGVQVRVEGLGLQPSLSSGGVSCRISAFEEL